MSTATKPNRRRAEKKIPFWEEPEYRAAVDLLQLESIADIIDFTLDRVTSERPKWFDDPPLWDAVCTLDNIRAHIRNTNPDLANPPPVVDRAKPKLH